MLQAGFILLLAALGFIVARTLSFDAFFIIITIGLATSGICQEISKLKDKPTDKKDNDDKKE